MAQKRKASEIEAAEEEPAYTVTTSQPSTTEETKGTETTAQAADGSESNSNTQIEPTSNSATLPNSAADARAARFAALKSRAVSSAASNLAAARQEASRQAIDTSQLAAISRRHAIASHNLLKAESESNEAFERKRAWDWTVDESEKWDKRMAKKEKHREEVGFRNYGDEASKIYRRQLREMNKQDAKRSQHNPGDGKDGTDGDQLDRLSAYEQSKIQTLLQAAQSGGLEIVESPDGSGELVLLDRHGTYVHPSSSTSFGEHMSSSLSTPSKENVDRLVNDLRKAEETRLKKRRDRGRANDEADMAGDVTFINDKNKVFNQKLRRFYDKYTRDIRESFERGTAI